MKHIVRSCDKMCFEVEPRSLTPKTNALYDPWCFSDPEKNVVYISWSDWAVKRAEMRNDATKIP